MHLPRRSAPVILSALTISAMVACSGGAASPTVSIPPVSIPPVSIPPVSIPPLPSVSIPPLPSGLPSFSIPPLPSGSGIPSFAIPTFHQAPDLEAQLPSQIRGVTLEKSSFTGDLFLGTGGDQTFQAVLNQFGKQPSDLAIAGASDTTGGLEFQLLVFRLAGVDGAQFIGAILSAGQASGSIQPTVSQGSVGNKQVTIFTDADGTKSYAYVRGDLVFVFESDADDADALLAEIANALP